ncbi:hypothetical protein CL618_03270 [archaeon]|nr:hypothetical protein [archaeon]|tara:strand:- start:1885 stop:2208 length:324 start_codon:yes stop_codon:yes gene_type:complete
MSEKMGENDESFRDFIELNLSMKTYKAILDYMDGLERHKQGRSRPLRLEGIGEVKHVGGETSIGCVKIGISTYGFPEAPEHTRESVQGLIDIVYGELSIPEGMRKRE